MLFLVFAGNAEAAQRAEAGVDAINRARLRGEGFDQFAAAADERTRFAGKFAAGAERGDLPDFANGKIVAVQRNHIKFRRRQLLHNRVRTGKSSPKKKLLHRVLQPKEINRPNLEMENRFLEKKLLRPFMVAIAGIIFSGCSTAP